MEFFYSLLRFGECRSMKSRLIVLVLVAVLVGVGAATVTAVPVANAPEELAAFNAQEEQQGQDGQSGNDKTNVRVENLTIENLTLTNVTVTNPRALNASVRLQPGGEQVRVPAARADKATVSANLTNVILEDVQIRNETLAKKLLGGNKVAGQNTTIHLTNVTLNNTTVSGAVIQNATAGNVSIDEHQFVEKKGAVPQRGPPAIQVDNASVDAISIENITIVDFKPKTVLNPRSENE